MEPSCDSEIPARGPDQARFEALFQASPVAQAVCRLRDNRVIHANEAFLRLLELPRGEVAGRSPAELGFLPWRDGGLAAELAAHPQTELTCRRPRGGAGIRDLVVKLRLLDPGGEAFVLLTLADVTERRGREAELARLTRLYATLSQINQMIVRVASVEELTREVSRIAVEYGGFQLAWVGRHNPRSQEVEPLGGAGEPWEMVRGFRHRVGEDGNPSCLCSPVVQKNKSCVVNDLSLESGMEEWLALVAREGIRAAAEFPIHVSGAVWGVLGVYDRDPFVFQDKEIALLEEAALDIGYAVEKLDGEAKRQRAEGFQQLSTAILGILNEPLPLHAACSAILARIKDSCGLDAVGIRLRAGEDFPYFTSDGLDQDFLLAEDSLLLREEDSGLCRNDDGRPSLLCTCGLVLEERCGPPSENVTAAGSFWTNDSPALIKALHGKDPRNNPRNRCIHEGYQSIALIPIRADHQVIGLLHLNDRRKHRFTPQDIHFFEGLAASLGIAVRRKQAEDVLRESEERFRSLVEGAPEAIFIQRDGVFQFVNRAMLSLLGATREDELLGQPVFPRIAAEYHEAVRGRIRSQSRTGMPSPLMEQVYLRLDGSRVPVETTATAIRIQGGEGHMVFVRDIRQRKELETLLSQAQKMESVGRLAGGVAHDFNNMLGIILGHADLALERLRPEDPLHADLTAIRNAGAHSAELTRQLLAFARKQTVAPQVIDLNQTVAGMAKMLRRLIGEDIVLEWAPAEDVWPVRIDPGQVDQLLANLCVNARDAIQGGGRLRIETANLVLGEADLEWPPGVPAGDYVRISVSDTGCGMDAETLAHLYEPFFTTKEMGKGTGLGLATVYGVVQQNHGAIRVDSRPGAGTTFQILLPRHKEERDSAAPAPPELPGREEHATILVVEDEPAILNLTLRMLAQAGHTVLGAGLPAQALELLEHHAGPLDLLLTDVVMPGMNGRELADAVQARHPGVRCLFMSGYTQDVIAPHGVVGPEVHFLEKPFSKQELVRKVRSVLDEAPRPAV